MAHSQIQLSGQHVCFEWGNGLGRYASLKAHTKSKMIYVRLDSYSPVCLTEAHARKLHQALGAVYGPTPSVADVQRTKIVTGELSDLLVRHRAGLSSVDRAIITEAVELLYRLANPVSKG